MNFTMVDLLSLRITLAVIFLVIFLIAMALIFLVICLRRRKLSSSQPSVRLRIRDAKLYGFGNEVYEGEPPTSENSFMNENSDYFGGSGNRSAGRHYSEIPERVTKVRTEFMPSEILKERNPQQPDVVQREMFRRPTDMSQSHYVYDYTYAHQLVPPPTSLSSTVTFNTNRQQIQTMPELHQTVVSFSRVNNMKSANHHTIQTVSLVHEAPPDVGQLLPNTPLARLSPSSGSSSQHTLRILTLQDISRKQLQSALLESTTSSSGNVSKGVIQSSNSDISWNKPVTGTGTCNVSEWSSVIAAPESKIEFKSDLKPSLGMPNENVDNVIATTSLAGVSSSIVDNNSSSDSDDNSFTCSEFEDDNEINVQSSVNKQSFRNSFSTVVTSEDDIASNDNAQQSFNLHTETTGVVSLDCLLNWGPNFESLEGVFKDIAQLPDSINNSSSSSNASKKSPSVEVYV